MLNELLFKYIIIGNSNTGKTSIVESFINNQYSQTPQNTIGVGFYSKILELDDKCLKIHIWDTGGLERFFSITKSYFRRTSVVIITYDITDNKSFRDVKFWYNSVKQDCDENTIIVVVGNKNDLYNRVISYNDGFEMSKGLNYQENILFFEINTINKEEIDQIFLESAREIIKRGLLNKPLKELQNFGIRNYSNEHLVEVKESNSLNCCNIS